MHRLMLFSIAIVSLPWPARAETINLTVAEPSGVDRQGWPVSSGIPLAAGALQDPQACALFAADGAEIPLQTEALARWPDGSIRWLLLDFQIDLAAGQKKALALRFGPDVRRGEIKEPLRVDRQPDGKVALETGAVRLEYDPARFVPQGAAWLTAGPGEPTERAIGNCTADGVWLEDDRGRDRSAAAGEAEITIEQAGPVRACLRVAGHHGRDPMFQYIARIHAWRGQPWVRVFYTLVNDHQDELMARIRKLEVRFWAGRHLGARSYLLDGKPVSKARLFQVDERHYLLDGARVDGRGRGWAAVGSDLCGLAVGLREFWQNWPKAIDCDSTSGCLSLELCPELPQGLYAGKPLEEESKLYYHVRDGLHTFKCGVAKTHEFWLNYFPGKPDAQKLSRFFQAAEEPLLATCDPAYASSTKAAGEFPPADPREYFGYDAWLDRALEAHLKRRGAVREYGMLNYGDWYGERSVNWGNLEYDLAHGLFLQYLRTGDRRYYERAEQAARHHIDVDVVHAVNPHLKNPWGDPPRVGDVWLHCVGHTGGYYENAPLPVDRTYQMGHSTNFGHVWVSGDLDYYHLSGDRRALEVSLEIAEAMRSHMPTQYSDHIRGVGWPMILVLAAYEATGDRKYLEAATKNWEVLKKNIDWERGWVVRLAKGHCLHEDRRCEGNVPFMEGLTLCALARYHRLTGDPEVLRAITVGIDQMIRECWQEDVKTFRYTACPLSSKAPYCLFMLSTEAMAYEVGLTGNDEHRRILREGVRAAIPKDAGQDFGKNMAQMIFFAPHGLGAL